MLSLISYWLLVANSVWDFVCVACMLFDIILGIASIIADAHFGLWLMDEDRTNKAAKILFMFFVMQWGMMRIISALDGDVVLGVMSYGAEGLLVVFGMVECVIEWRKGTAVFLMSVACAMVLLFT